MAKKFKDTKVGSFLKSKGSFLLNALGDAVPDKGFMGIVKNLLIKDDEMPLEDKETALKLLEMDSVEMQEVSKRWNSDMISDSWLSKNTRPLTLIYLTVITSLYILLDALDIAFDIDQAWIELLKTLLVTIYVAYFGSRGFEKVRSIMK